MKFDELSLKGSFLITPTPFEDSRGFFTRWFCNKEFEENNLETSFVQCNHSGTTGKGSIRGMHFQYPPDSEVKLIKCISGRIFDVIIDLRKQSPTFLNWTGVELSSEMKNMIYVPKGFAHGFQTLTEEAEIIYMVSSFYTKNAEGGVRFDDPSVKIEWPLAVNKISEKDQAIPLIVPEHFNGLTI